MGPRFDIQAFYKGFSVFAERIWMVVIDGLIILCSILEDQGIQGYGYGLVMFAPRIKCLHLGTLFTVYFLRSVC